MQDTFSAGVELGLYSLAEIKTLIGYMLYTVKQPVPRQTIVDALTTNAIANYFDACTALEELERADNIRQEEEGMVLTEVGEQVAQTLGIRVRFSLRERAVATTLQLLARQKRERENTVRIEPLEQGCAVTCVIEEGDYPLLSLTLRVADREQARLIEEHFLSDPTGLYQEVIGVLTKTEEKK